MMSLKSEFEVLGLYRHLARTKVLQLTNFKGHYTLDRVSQSLTSTGKVKCPSPNISLERQSSFLFETLKFNWKTKMKSCKKKK